MPSDRPRARYEPGEARTAYLFLAPVVGAIALFVLVPVAGTLYTSLFHDVSYMERAFVGLDNYRAMFESEPFRGAVGFTLLLTATTVALEMAFGTAFAVLLSERFPGRGVLRAIILIPWAIPTIVSAQTWKLIFQYTYGILNVLLTDLGLAADKINWLGTPASAFWALVVAEVWKTTPFVVLIVLAGLQAIPQEVIRQAKVDGAGMLTRFRRITLPLLRPVLVIALVFRTIDSLRIFDLVYVLTGGGPGGATKTLSVLGFNYFTDDRFGMGSAVSVATFLIAFAITLVYIRVGRFRETIG